MRLQRVGHNWANFTLLISRQPSCRLRHSCDLPTHRYCFFLKYKRSLDKKSLHHNTALQVAGKWGKQGLKSIPCALCWACAPRPAGTAACPASRAPGPYPSPSLGQGAEGPQALQNLQRLRDLVRLLPRPVHGASSRNGASDLGEPLWAWLQGGHHAAPWRLPRLARRRLTRAVLPPRDTRTWRRALVVQRSFCL